MAFPINRLALPGHGSFCRASPDASGRRESISACTSGCLRLIRTESSPTSRPERNQSNRISSAGSLARGIRQCSQRLFDWVGHVASSIAPCAESARGHPTEGEAWACQPATSITEVAGDSAEVSDKPADSTGRRPVGFDVGVLFERGVQSHPALSQQHPTEGEASHGGRLGSCHDQETKKPRRSGARRQVVQA